MKTAKIKCKAVKRGMNLHLREYLPSQYDQLKKAMKCIHAIYVQARC